MKQKFLLLCTLLLTAVFMARSAQAAGFEFALGPKFDIGVAWYSGDDWVDYLNDVNYDNRPVLAFSFGIMFDMTFFRADIFGLGFQPELLFSLKGGGQYHDIDNYWEERLMGIDIPLLVKPKFRLGSGDLYALLGPVIFIPFGKVYQEGETNGTYWDDDYNPKYDEDATVGIGVGIGYDITLGPGKLEIGLLYTPYLTKLDHNNDTLDNKFVFSVGYAFNVVK